MTFSLSATDEIGSMVELSNCDRQMEIFVALFKLVSPRILGSSLAKLVLVHGKHLGGMFRDISLNGPRRSN